MAETATSYSSIGLAGYAVGTIQMTPTVVKWAPREMDEAPSKDVKLDEVLRASWAPMGRMTHVRLFCKDGTSYRFDGFKKTDMEGVGAYFEGREIDFKQEAVASGGGNYGELNFGDNSSMALRKGGADLFELNLANVSQCVVPGVNKRDEIELQFHESDTAQKDDHGLVGMRLWVPGATAAEVQQKVMNKTAISSVTGEVLVTFDMDTGSFLMPRSHYEVEMYDTFLRMHGNMYDYKIKYDDISRYYMLERPNGRNFNFVICLEKPIRQGQQKYPYLVWQTVNETSEVTVNLTEEQIAEKFTGESGLKPTMEGGMHALIARIFKALTGKQVFSHSRKFRSANEHHCVACAHRARNGLLYPNDKSFVYLHQPTLVIPFTEVDYVEFERPENTVAGASVTRNFDFVVQLKAKGEEAAKRYSFNAIEKKEYKPLVDFLNSKSGSITIRNLQEVESAVAAQQGLADEDDESDEEDEDFGSDDGSGSDSSSDGSDEEGDASDDMMEETAKASKKRKKSSKSKAKKEPEEVASPKKRKKDPNAPKKARSAYQLYANSVREEIKTENPDKSFGEQTKIMAAKWRELGDEDKAAWQAKADTDKTRFKDAMADYEPPSDVEVTPKKGKGKKGKAAKDPNAPKGATTAYFFFLADTRETTKAENPGMSVTELSKVIGAKWKELTPEGKAPFEEKAKADKERYATEKAAYEGKKAAEEDPMEEDDSSDAGGDSD